MVIWKIFIFATPKWPQSQSLLPLIRTNIRKKSSGQLIPIGKFISSKIYRSFRPKKSRDINRASLLNSSRFLEFGEVTAARWWNDKTSKYQNKAPSSRSVGTKRRKTFWTQPRVHSKKSGASLQYKWRIQANFKIIFFKTKYQHWQEKIKIARLPSFCG